MWVVLGGRPSPPAGTLERGAQAYSHPILFFENIEPHSNLCVHCHGLLFWQQIVSRKIHSSETGMCGPVSLNLALAPLFVSCLPGVKCHLHKELSELSWPMIIP